MQYRNTMKSSLRRTVGNLLEHFKLASFRTFVQCSVFYKLVECRTRMLVQCSVFYKLVECRTLYCNVMSSYIYLRRFY